MRITILFITIIIIQTTTSFASDKSELKTLMINYLQALKSKDIKKIKKVVSPKYFKMLNSNKVLELTFNKKLKEPNKKVTGNFDLTYQQGNTKKDLYFVNIKNKTTKEYNDYWYLVRKKKGEYIIDDMQLLEE